MTTPDPNEQGSTAPIELPGHQPPPPTQPEHAPPPPPELHDPMAPAEPTLDGAPSAPPAAATAPTAVSRAVAAPGHPEVTYVPLAVSIGDGFKFGCGFFLAMVVAVLVAFVLLAALFVLTGLLGLSLPLGR